MSFYVELVSPLAVTLNDVIVDAEALLAAAMSHGVAGEARDANEREPVHHSARVAHEHLRELQRIIGDLQRDMAAVATDENACLQRCQFSLYALIEAARACCAGLDLDDPLRVSATACRRKAQATLFTVQWLLARRVQQHA